MTSRSLAILSDIHANLPALEAVLNDLDGRQGIIGTYHLGDLVGYAPWPNEVVSLLIGKGIQGIAGNYDSTVATAYDHCGCSYQDPREIALAHESYSWTLEHTSQETRNYLGGLPFRIDIRPRGGHISGPKITLVHGNPVLNTVYWTEERSEAFSVQMGGKVGAVPGDSVVFGHTHKPWHKVIHEIRFVNAGSVGRPKDGDWRACYLLLHLDSETGDREAGAIQPEFVRVEYDVERAREGIFSSGLPTEFAEALMTGGAKNTS